MGWKEKKALLASAIIPAIATYLVTTGDIPNKPENDNALSLKGKNHTERIIAMNFEKENAKQGEEITTLRTKNTKVIKESSNKFIAEISPKSRYWFDSQDSVFRKIDLSVHDIHPLAKVNPLRKIDKYVHAGQYATGWKDEHPNDYIFIHDELEVKYITLFDITENLSIITEPKPEGVKQTIIVKNKTSAKIKLAWYIETNADSIKLENKQIVYYINETRKARIKQPIVWDAKRQILFAQYTLINDTLSIKVNYPEKVAWPVTVDPTTTVDDIDDLSGCLVTYSGSVWTARDSSDASGFLADYSYLWFTGASQVNRILYRFDTSGLPDDVTVTGAALKFVVSDTTGKGEDFFLKIIEAQDSLDTAHLNASMYNEFKGWAAGGVAYSPTILSDSLSTAARAYGDTLTFTLNYIGNADISLTGTSQFWMVSGVDMGRSPTPGGSQYMGFEDDSPYLYITYYTTPIIPTLSISAVSDASVSLTIGANGNGADIKYSIKITHPGGHQNYWSGADTTATETFKTLADWGAMPEVINQRLVTNGEYWLDSRSNNSDAVYSAWVRIGARAWDKRLRNRLVAVDSSGTNSNAAVGEYLKSRAALSPDSIGTIGMSVGQNTGMSVFRSHYDFKSLLSTANIDGGSLYVYINTDQSDTDFDVRLYQSSWMRNLAVDYRHTMFNGWQPGELLYAGTEHATAVGTSGISDPFILVLNAAGLSYYNSKRASADTTRWSLISSRDCGANEPTGLELISLSNVALHVGRDSVEVDNPIQNVVLTINGVDTLTVNWSIELGSNIALALVDSVTGITVGDTLDYNDTTIGIGSLTPNSYNCYRVKIIGGVHDGEYSSYVQDFTRANVPGKPTLTVIDNSKIKFVINVNSNPSYTKFAVIDSFTNKFVYPVAGLCTLGTSAQWATYETWGGINGDTLAVDKGQVVALRVKARSSDR